MLSLLVTSLPSYPTGHMRASGPPSFKTRHGPFRSDRPGARLAYGQGIPAAGVDGLPVLAMVVARIAAVRAHCDESPSIDRCYGRAPLAIPGVQNHEPSIERVAQRIAVGLRQTL